MRFLAHILPKADSTSKETQKCLKNRISQTTFLRARKEDKLLARENESRTNGKEPKIALISIWSKRVGLETKQEMVRANLKR